MELRSKLTIRGRPLNRWSSSQLKTKIDGEAHWTMRSKARAALWIYGSEEGRREVQGRASGTGNPPLSGMYHEAIIENAIRDAQDVLWDNLAPTGLPDREAIDRLWNLVSESQVKRAIA